MKHKKEEKLIYLADYKENTKGKIKYRNNTLYILIGLPCSGKSFYAQNMMLNNNTVIVSTDELRKEITGTYMFNEESNKEIIKEAKNRIKDYISLGYDVVFDATNTNKNYRKSFVNIGRQNECRVIAVVFKTPLEICIERNNKRSSNRRVPEEIILLMSNFNSEIGESEGFNRVEYIY